MSKPKAGTNDLLAFAVTRGNRAHGACDVCALAECELINDARRRAPKGAVGGKVVRDFLIERCGYAEETTPTVNQIQNHFNRGHHQEGA